jgi:glutathione reductase (NADPH)
LLWLQNLIEDNGRLLGAHLLGPEADELINVFALAIQSATPAERLKEILFAYPTHASDVTYML